MIEVQKVTVKKHQKLQLQQKTVKTAPAKHIHADHVQPTFEV